MMEFALIIGAVSRSYADVVPFYQVRLYRLGAPNDWLRQFAWTWNTCLRYRTSDSIDCPGIDDHHVNKRILMS